MKLLATSKKIIFLKKKNHFKFKNKQKNHLVSTNPRLELKTTIYFKEIDFFFCFTFISLNKF